MALSQVSVNSFSDQQAEKSKYWYERIPYTAGPLVLVPQSNQVFAMEAGNQGSPTPEWRTHLRRPASSQDVDVYYTLKADKNLRFGGNTESGATAALRAGYRPDDAFDVAAIESMSLSLFNATAANKTGFHFNYEIGRHRMTVAEKLFLGMGESKLTPVELDALDYATSTGQIKADSSERPFHVRAGLQKGSLPFPSSAQIERRIMSRVRYIEPVTFYVPGVGSSIPTAIGNPVTASVADDEVLALLSLGVENDPGTGSPPNAKLAVNRDTTEENYIGLNLNEYLQADDLAWQFFMPAKHRVSFYAQAYAGTVDILLRGAVAHIKRSDVIDAWWGLKGPRDMPARTYYGAIAGVA